MGTGKSPYCVQLSTHHRCSGGTLICGRWPEGGNHHYIAALHRLGVGDILVNSLVSRQSDVNSDSFLPLGVDRNSGQQTLCGTPAQEEAQITVAGADLPVKRMEGDSQMLWKRDPEPKIRQENENPETEQSDEEQLPLEMLSWKFEALLLQAHMEERYSLLLFRLVDVPDIVNMPMYRRIWWASYTLASPVEFIKFLWFWLQLNRSRKSQFLGEYPPDAKLTDEIDEVLLWQGRHQKPILRPVIDPLLLMWGADKARRKLLESDP
jgi:hypothetical protein